MYKKSHKKYRQLPPKKVESVKWKRVNVDIVGPFMFCTSQNKKHVLQALTMIDPVTCWFEIKDLKEINSNTTMEAFNNYWLCRYPRPQQISFDNGSEFVKHETMARALAATTYFAHPYSSWERGINANTNGLLRQFFPKHTDFRTVSWPQVKQAVDLLNNRRRNTRGDRTPNQLFHHHFVPLVEK